MVNFDKLQDHFDKLHQQISQVAGERNQGNFSFYDKWRLQIAESNNVTTLETIAQTCQRETLKLEFGLHKHTPTTTTYLWFKFGVNRSTWGERSKRDQRYSATNFGTCVLENR